MAMHILDCPTMQMGKEAMEVVWKKRGKTNHLSHPWPGAKGEGRSKENTDAVADLTARIHALCKAQRRLEQEKVQEESIRWEQADAPLRDLECGTDMLVRSALTLARFTTLQGTGFGGRDVSDMPDRSDDSTLTDLDHLRAVLERAEQGDDTAVPELREALDAHSSIWKQYADLARQARDAWLGHVAGDNLLLRESLDRKLAAFELELGLAQSSPLERLVIGRVVACWLMAEYADLVCTRSLQGGELDQRIAHKRQKAAHRRLLTSISQLAFVRRLLHPPEPLRLLPVSAPEGAR
jgi:hypothetical protein